MHKLIVAVVSPLVLVALIISASHAKPPRQVARSFIRLGEGPHLDPAVNPELPVLRHEVEHYYDAPSDRIMTFEGIEYEDGSVTAKIGPHRSELDRQQAPAPANVQPPPCTPVVESATNQANAQAGTVHCAATVLCRVNGGLQSCPKIGYSLSIYQLQHDGSWLKINSQAGESAGVLICNARATPFADGSVDAAGTFRFAWTGWNTGTGAFLWSLTTQIDYEG